nr:sensor domain-containing protein [Mycobacterium sp. 852013-50091_SCH5140682]
MRFKRTAILFEPHIDFGLPAIPTSDGIRAALSGVRARLGVVGGFGIGTVGRSPRIGVAALGLILSACSSTVGGNAAAYQPSQQTGDRVQSIRQVLPESGELSVAVGAPMQSESEASVGGIGSLPNGLGDASPIECLGVHSPRMRRTYQDAPVTGAVDGEWETGSGSVALPDPDIRITVGVIELDSAASSHSWYSKFASQWQQCDGKTMTMASAIAGSHEQNVAEVTNVADSDGVISAAVLVRAGVADTRRPLVKQRALTAASRFIVDVEVVQIDSNSADRVTDDQAVAVARLTANRIVSTG